MSENATQNGLTPKQTRGIEALLTEPNVRAAAKALHVNEATLWRWLAEPAFSNAYHDAQSRLFENAIAILQLAMGEAVETLRAVLRDSAAKPGELVSAARTILEFALRSRELFELEKRLAALESAMKPA